MGQPKEKLGAVMTSATPTQRAELNSAAESGDALAKAFPLPNVPIVQLTVTLKDPGFPGNPVEQDIKHIKLQLHNEFLAKVPQARHVLVPNSRHYIQEDAPQLVIGAVRIVVETAHKADAHGSKH